MKFPKEVWQAEKRKWLEGDNAIGFKKSPGGGYQYGKCPNPKCGKDSLWVGSGLSTIQCNHTNSCGFSVKVEDHYPGIYQALCDQHGPDPQDPLGRAKNYLQRRGFEIKDLKGLFSQESAKSKTDNKWYYTTRFFLTEDKSIYWERFIDCSQKHKANFAPVSYKGLCWEPPMVNWDEVKRIWITEGIFNSLSLIQSGLVSIATLSTNNLPSKVIEQHKGKGITWVIAFDNDPINPRTGKNAGLDAAIRLAGFLGQNGEKHEYAFPPIGRDWNDLLKAGKLDEEAFDLFFWRGRLLTAKTVRDYGYQLSKKRRASIFAFSFNKGMWGWEPGEKLYADLAELGEDPSEKETKNTTLQNVKIKALSNFSLSFLYCEINDLEDLRSYFFRSHKENETPSNFSIDAASLASRDHFKKIMLNKYSGALFSGSAFWLDTFLLDGFRQKIDTVKLLPWGGYDPATKAYVFKEVAYDKEGTPHKPNDYEYFTLPGQLKVKTSYAEKLTFSEQFHHDWFKDYFIYFRLNGIAALSFWLSSLFAEQLRAKFGHHPFFAAVGIPGTGKSTMFKFLWKLICRDRHEGVPLNEASTLLGLYAELAQGSNIPTVLIETPEKEDDKKRMTPKFNFENIKGLYDDGAILRTKAKKTAGNDNIKPKFKSTIIIGQNEKIDGTTAIRERFCEFLFTKDHFTEDGLQSADRISSWEIDKLCGFRHHVLSNRVSILKDLVAYNQEGIQFMKERSRNHPKGALNNHRIVENFSFLYAAGCVLKQLLPPFDNKLLEQYKIFILNKAVERQEDTSEDSWVVQQFFDTFLDLEIDDRNINHSANPDEFIAVNINDFVSICGKRSIGDSFRDIKRLKRNLRNSKKYKFIQENKVVNSKTSEKSKRCWVFQRP